MSPSLICNIHITNTVMLKLMAVHHARITLEISTAETWSNQKCWKFSWHIFKINCNKKAEARNDMVLTIVHPTSNKWENSTSPQDKQAVPWPKEYQAYSAIEYKQKSKSCTISQRRKRNLYNCKTHKFKSQKVNTIYIHTHMCVRVSKK